MADGASQPKAGDASADNELLTEDLLKRLLDSANVEQFLQEEDIATRALPDYLYELLHARRLKRSKVINGSGLNGTVVYDYFSGKSRPGRDHAIMLAFGLRCNLREAQRLLRTAGVSELWVKQRRDAIIIWCLQEGLTRAQCDDELWRLGEKTLLGTDRLS